MQTKNANCYLTYLFNDSVKSATLATNWWRLIEMKESKSSKLPAKCKVSMAVAHLSS